MEKSPFQDSHFFDRKVEILSHGQGFVMMSQKRGIIYHDFFGFQYFHPERKGGRI